MEKRSDNGLAFLASYTLSKSIDDSPGNSTARDASSPFPQNSSNLRGERGLSNFDTRHRLVFSTVYQLPFGPGRAYLSQPQNILGKLIGGWEIAGIATLQSGRPYTPYINADISNTGGQLSDRPNLIGNPKLDNPRPELWLNGSAFALPAQFTFGNAGRNILLGDGLVNFDFALMNIRFRENKALQFRAESFNVFNHPNFVLPVTPFDSARFGSVPSTSTDPRDIQFGIKIIFLTHPQIVAHQGSLLTLRLFHVFGVGCSKECRARFVF